MNALLTSVLGALAVGLSIALAGGVLAAAFHPQRKRASTPVFKQEATR